VASEIEINRKHQPDRLLGMCEAGSAIILEAADAQPADRNTGGRGFGPFVYHFDLANSDARTITGIKRHDKPYFYLQQTADVNDRFADAVAVAVAKLLDQKSLSLADFDVVLPPQFSPAFNQKLAERLGLPLEKFIDFACEGQDLFTNSLGFGLQQALATGRAKAGNLGLIISVSSGIQAACTTYRF
jgi:3-oxoacyl-[acyl-carrier-protein] synthase III